MGFNQRGKRKTIRSHQAYSERPLRRAPAMAKTRTTSARMMMTAVIIWFPFVHFSGRSHPMGRSVGPWSEFQSSAFRFPIPQMLHRERAVKYDRGSAHRRPVANDEVR